MEEGSGWETHVYQWRIHVGIWQNQYNIVKFKNKIKLKKKESSKKKKKKQRIKYVLMFSIISIVILPVNILIII